MSGCEGLGSSPGRPGGQARVQPPEGATETWLCVCHFSGVPVCWAGGAWGSWSGCPLPRPTWGAPPRGGGSGWVGRVGVQALPLLSFLFLPAGFPLSSLSLCPGPLPLWEVQGLWVVRGSQKRRAGRGSLMASPGCGLPHQPARGPALPGQQAATAVAEPPSPTSAEPGLVERGSALDPAEVGDLGQALHPPTLRLPVSSGSVQSTCPPRPGGLRSKP